MNLEERKMFANALNMINDLQEAYLELVEAHFDRCTRCDAEEYCETFDTNMYIPGLAALGSMHEKNRKFADERSKKALMDEKLD